MSPACQLEEPGEEEQLFLVEKSLSVFSCIVRLPETLLF